MVKKKWGKKKIMSQEQGNLEFLEKKFNSIGCLNLLYDKWQEHSARLN